MKIQKTLYQGYSTHKNYRADVDGLRALAIISVILFHSFPGLMKGGFIGVDIFFVISGFLISNIVISDLNNGDFSILEFYARRIKRIFPALIIILVASIIFGWLILLSDEYKQLGKYIAAAASFSTNLITWDELGYFDNSIDTKPLAHLWSLGVEEQFYLIWPLLVWLTWRTKLTGLIITLLLGMLSFYINIESSSRDHVSAFYLPQTRFWELMTGCILSGVFFNKDYISNLFKYILKKLNSEKSVSDSLLLNLPSFVGLTILIYGFSRIDREANFPGFWALVPVLGSSLILVSSPNAWINRRILSHPISVWFGLISYPLYLWHWPILSFTRIIENGVLSTNLRLALLSLSILLAWLTYTFIETPIRSKKSIKNVMPTIIILMLLIGISGYLIHKTTFFKPKFIKVESNSQALINYDNIFANNPNYVSDIFIDRQKEIRSPFCHFNKPNQSFEEYQKNIDKCLTLDKSKKNILIIGDSHAADLYVAINKTHNFNLLQATGAGCTAIRKNYKDTSVGCFKLIDYGIKFAQIHHVDTVILASRWPENFEGVAGEINDLKKSIKNIILVGPPLEFNEDVNKFISRRSSKEDLSILSRKFINPKKLSLNNRMANFAKKNGISYIDRISLFCDFRNICQLLSENGELYIFDYGHLSTKGAIYLGNRILEKDFLSRAL